DDTLTGVQTCALPIYLRFDGKIKIKLESENDVKLNSVELEILEVEANGSSVKYKLGGEDFIVRTGKFAGELSIIYRGSISDKLRSEERRVGKERICRS